MVVMTAVLTDGGDEAPGGGTVAILAAIIASHWPFSCIFVKWRWLPTVYRELQSDRK